MNLLLYIFIVLISVSILFLLMYLHYFKKLKQIKSKNVEHFEIVAKIPEICEDDIKNFIIFARNEPLKEKNTLKSSNFLIELNRLI